MTVLTERRKAALEANFRKHGGKVLDLKSQQVVELMAVFRKQIENENNKNVFYRQ